MTDTLEVRGKHSEMHIDGDTDSDGDVGFYGTRKGHTYTSVYLNKQHAEQIIKHLTEVFGL